VVVFKKKVVQKETAILRSVYTHFQEQGIILIGYRVRILANPKIDSFMV
jgi:hypothetical protein